MHIIYDDKKIEVGRVYAGFAWPGERPGFAVLVAEEKYPEIGYAGRYHYHLCKEVEEADKERLIIACLNWKNEFKVDINYFGGPQDNENYRFLWTWNHKFRPEGLPMFDVYPATHNELIGSLIDILKSTMSKENPRLHNMKGSKSLNYLMEVRPENQAKMTESDNPAVAALAYAVSSLAESLPRHEDARPRVRRKPTTVTGY